MQPEVLSENLDFDEGDKVLRFSSIFQPISVLGKGSFGIVIAAKEISTLKIRAVKILIKRDYASADVARIRQEADILSSLHHKNIVRFIKIYETETRLLIVMDLVRDGSLHSVIRARKQANRSFSHSEAATLMRCLLDAVCYIHQRGIVHRDLKPENILIDDCDDFSTLKLADFGLSAKINFRSEQGNALYTNCGTLSFKGPELITKKLYSKPVDIWSCGIIMYILLAGKHPFYTGKETRAELEEKILSPNWSFPPEMFNSIAKDLFLKLVKMEPSKRYAASQAIRHPWITQSEKTEIPLTMPEIYQLIRAQNKFKGGLKVLLLLGFLKGHEEIKEPKIPGGQEWIPLETSRSGKMAEEIEEIAFDKERKLSDDCSIGKKNRGGLQANENESFTNEVVRIDTKFHTFSEFSNLLKDINMKYPNNTGQNLSRNLVSLRKISQEEIREKECERQRGNSKSKLISRENSSKMILNVDLKSNQHHKKPLVIRNSEGWKQSSSKGIPNKETVERKPHFRSTEEIQLKGSGDSLQKNFEGIQKFSQIKNDSLLDSRHASPVRIRNVSKPPIAPNPKALQPKSNQLTQNIYHLTLKPMTNIGSKDLGVASPLLPTSQKSTNKTLSSLSTVVNEKENLRLSKVINSFVFAPRSKSLSSQSDSRKKVTQNSSVVLSPKKPRKEQSPSVFQPHSSTRSKDKTRQRPSREGGIREENIMNGFLMPKGLNTSRFLAVGQYEEISLPEKEDLKSISSKHPPKKLLVTPYKQRPTGIITKKPDKHDKIPIISPLKFKNS